MIMCQLQQDPGAVPARVEPELDAQATTAGRPAYTWPAGPTYQPLVLIQLDMKVCDLYPFLS
jgi:hypothetical protein